MNEDEDEIGFVQSLTKFNILYIATKSKVFNSVSVFTSWQVLSESMILFDTFFANVCKKSNEQTAGKHIPNLNWGFPVILFELKEIFVSYFDSVE